MSTEAGQRRGAAHVRGCFLRKSTDFTLAFAHGQRLAGSRLNIHYRPNGLSHPRLGLAVARRAVAHATARNRIKRVLRETFRARAADIAGLDLVVAARPGVAELANAALRAEFLALLQRLPRLAP